MALSFRWLRAPPVSADAGAPEHAVDRAAGGG